MSSSSEDMDFVPAGRRGRRRPYYEEAEADEYDDFDDEYEDDEFDEEEEEEDEDIDESVDEALGYLESVMNDWEAEDYDLYSNVVIPNALLDNMDPDGASERAPELFSDLRFWFDLVIFLLLMDFISYVGPQNAFLQQPM